MNEATSSEENKTQVIMMENRLTKLMEVLKSSPISDAKKLNAEITW